MNRTKATESNSRSMDESFTNGEDQGPHGSLPGKKPSETIILPDLVRRLRIHLAHHYTRRQLD